jgi:hypothetical protein
VQPDRPLNKSKIAGSPANGVSPSPSVSKIPTPPSNGPPVRVIYSMVRVPPQYSHSSPSKNGNSFYQWGGFEAPIAFGIPHNDGTWGVTVFVWDVGDSLIHFNQRGSCHSDKQQDWTQHCSLFYTLGRRRRHGELI